MARGTALSCKISSQLNFVQAKIPGALRKGGLEGLGEDYRGLLVCYSRYIIERSEARSVSAALLARDKDHRVAQATLRR